MFKSTQRTLALTVASTLGAIASCNAFVCEARAQPISAEPTRHDQPADTVVPEDAHDAPQSSDGDAVQRQREGTRLVNEQGYFRTTGEGLTFHMSGSEEKYPGLENLALERIAKIMSDRHDNPDRLVWEVSGFFTEYRGGNYLFITHAVLKNKSRRRRATP